MLRPYASPLPLGFFCFTVGMVLIAGVGLGWLGRSDLTTVGVVMALFVFPLQLMSTICIMRVELPPNYVGVPYDNR